MGLLSHGVELLRWLLLLLLLLWSALRTLATCFLSYKPSLRCVCFRHMRRLQMSSLITQARERLTLQQMPGLLAEAEQKS